MTLSSWMRLLLLNLCLHVLCRVGAQEEAEDVAACLLQQAHPKQCSPQPRDCSAKVYTQACLLTPIPPLLASRIDVIECCFHCCLAFYAHLFDLQPSPSPLASTLHRAFPATHTNLAASALVNSSAVGLLFSAGVTSLALSNHAVTPSGKAGRPPVQRVATLTVELEQTNSDSDIIIDVNAPPSPDDADAINTLPWAELRASEATLFTPSLSRCIPFTLERHPITATHLGLPVGRSKIEAHERRLAALATVQLPCSLARDQHLVTGNSSFGMIESGDAVGRRGRGVTNRPPALLLIPMGARDPVALREALAAPATASGVNEWTLDCRCAFGSSSEATVEVGKLGLEETLRQLCRSPPSSHSSSNSGTAVKSAASSTKGGGAEGMSLLQDLNADQARRDGKRRGAFRDYYSAIRPHNNVMVLSLSRPGRLTACEWEAVQLGATPVLPASFRTALTGNEWTKELYAKLPLVPLQANSSLASLAAEVRALSQSGQSHDIAAAYLPHWIHALIPFLHAGKSAPSVHAFTRSTRLYVKDKDKAGAGSAAGRCPAGFNTTSVRTSDGDRLHIVVPLCCEGPAETEWLSLLSSLPGTRTHAYHKCAHCLPSSHAKKWLPQAISSARSLEARFGLPARGVGLIDAMPTKSNIHRYLLLDAHSNTKEVAAYLTYIYDNYNALPAYVLFVHASPYAHAHFGLFFRAIGHALFCPLPLPRRPDGEASDAASVAIAASARIPRRLFLPLNYLYRSGEWGQCCGCKGACKRDVWRLLFGLEGNASTPGSSTNVSSYRLPGSTRPLVGVYEFSQSPRVATRERDIGKGRGRGKGRESGAVRAFAVGAGKAGRATSRKRRNKPGGDGRSEEAESTKETSRRLRRRLSMLFALNPHDVLADKREDDNEVAGRRPSAGWGPGELEPFAAYSSAQFLVARDALLSVPKDTYLQMLLAINGSLPLPGCNISSNMRVGAWGGHQLTGMYERMWHVLFGEPRRQVPRSQNVLLPAYLRLDCLPLGQGRCQEELVDRSPQPDSENITGGSSWTERGRLASAQKLKDWKSKAKRKRARKRATAARI